jgi:hypothetical protein
MKRLFGSGWFAWVVICTLCVVSGCSSKLVSEKEQAIAVAKQEVTRRGWKDIEVEDARLENGHWVVTLWSLPKTPGGHATVEVSTDGKMLRYLPGL